MVVLFAFLFFLILYISLSTQVDGTCTCSFLWLICASYTIKIVNELNLLNFNSFLQNEPKYIIFHFTLLVQQDLVRIRNITSQESPLQPYGHVHCSTANALPCPVFLASAMSMLISLILQKGGKDINQSLCHFK